MSFYTSLSGLKGAQTDLGVVSNNIANVGSFGFKKSRAQFGDIVAASRTTAGQGTRLKKIEQQFSQGGFEASSKELDLAIAGNGFFMTRDGLTGGTTYFSRNGSFSIDSDRYLVDSNGGYVQVLPVDPEGNVTSGGITSARNLQLPLTSGTPRATSLVELSIGFPSNAQVPTSPFDRLDPNSYNHSIQTTVYDSSGNTFAATMYYVRTQSTAAGDPTNTWDTYLFVGNEQASAGGTPPTPLTLEFDAAGALVSPAAPATFSAVQPSGASSPIALTLDFGAATNQSTGTFTLASLEQDGFAAGKLDDVSISEEGLVTATFSNGETQALGKLVLANFSNPTGLKQRGDARWSVTGDSGDAIIGAAGEDGFGRVQSGALERANVDITEELVALIAAQRNFQANAKAIETANTMTQAIFNLRS
jgi:flagellar hook protein FlgE